MSCMFSTNDCVPAGGVVQLIAGDNPSPGATPSAAWLNFTGICPPSLNPETVSVIAGPAGAPPARCPPPPRCPGVGAESATVKSGIVANTYHRRAFMVSPVEEAGAV